MDKRDIEKYYEFLNHEEETEIRVIDINKQKIVKKVHVKNIDELLKICKDFYGKSNIYAGINERVVGGTGKKDVNSLTIIPLDIDAPHPKNEAATSEELQKAKEVMKKIYDYFTNNDFKHPMVVMSGNGYQILWKIQPIKITDENRISVENKVKKFIDMVKERFETDEVTIDQVGDLPRIMKVPGTKSVKGKDTKERPYRYTFIEKEPDEEPCEKMRDKILLLETEEHEGEPAKTDNKGSNIENLKKFMSHDKKLRKLIKGELTDEYASRSEAELALVCKLVFYNFNRKQIDEIMTESKIGKWQEKGTGYKKMTIDSAFEKVKERWKEEKLILTKTGKSSHLLQKEKIDSSGSLKFIDILAFSSIKCNNFDYFSAVDNKFEPREIMKFRNGDEEFRYQLDFKTSDETFELIKALSAASTYKSRLKYAGEIEYWMQNHAHEQFKFHEGLAAPLFGGFLYNNKILFLSSDNASLLPYNLKELKVNTEEVEKQEEFIQSVKIKDDDIKYWLKQLKNLAKQPDVKNKIFNTIAWSLVAPLRFALFDFGVKMMPNLVIVGPKGVGKSTILLNLFINAMHGITSDRNAQHLGGTGIRLKSICTYSMRPTTIDDVRDVGEFSSILSMLKQGATSKFGSSFPRGTKKMVVYEEMLPRPLALTANEINIDDDAFFERFIVIETNEKFKKNVKKLDTEEFIRLKQCGTMIGKLLTQIYRKLDVDVLKKIVREEKKKNPNRAGDKIAILEVGMYILKQLYKKYDIEFEDDFFKPIYVNMKNYVIESRFESLNSALFETLQEQMQDGLGKRYTFIQLARDIRDDPEIAKEEDTIEAIKKFQDKGMFISKLGYEVLLRGKNYKGLINKFRREGKINSMTHLSEELAKIGIENKYIDNKHTVATCLGEHIRNCVKIDVENLLR